MALSIIFWVILIYFLYKFIFGFVIPVIAATRNVRSKMKDFRQNMGEFEDVNQSSTTTGSTAATKPGRTNTTPSKGDYIDFEEIK